MYLKSLTLKGFKSFADRTHMAFDPGLNVIVGPNGSGKSNVSDAILWVLGEQSAKQLRGQAMEDVVFAGSSARKPVGVAEVDLVLDNSDHTLAVDFDEVAITRRMYRSGESEYLINGAPARLLDVTDILHDSGLGKETRSIISQGKLDEILTSRPEERRALIEEAAGISKHKRRRERSLRKIDAMDDHLKSALRLQRELTRQLKPLKQQVEQAQRHAELTARASELSISLAVDDLRRLQGEWAGADERGKAADQALAQAKAAMDEREGSVADLAGQADELAQTATRAAEARRRSQTAAQGLAAARRVLAEKARAAQNRIDQASQSEASDQSAFEEAAQALAQTQEELVEARSRHNELKETAGQARVSLDQTRKARQAAESRADAAAKQLADCRRSRDAASVALAKAADSLESAKVQDDLLAARIRQLTEALEAADLDEGALGEKTRETEGMLACARDAEQKAQEALELARTRLSEAQTKDREARSAHARAEAEVAGLERTVAMEENRAPLAAKLARDPVAAATSGRVFEALSVPEDLSGLVESLLADRMRGFVIEGRDGLSQVALRAQQLVGETGQVSLVGLIEGNSQDWEGASDSDTAPQDGLAGYALTDRLGDEVRSAAVAQALLSDVRVVDDLAQAVTASLSDRAHTYVTAAGDAVCAGSLVTVGRPADVAQGLLANERKLEEARARKSGLAQSLQDRALELTEAEAALAQARADRERASADLARLKGEAAALSNQAARAKREAQATRDELARVGRKREEAQAASKDMDEQATRQRALLDQAEGQIAQLESQQKDLADQLEQARAQERGARGADNNCQLELARVQERVRLLDSRYNELSRTVAATKARLESARGSLGESRRLCERIEPLLYLLEDLSLAAQDVAGQVADKADEAQALADQLRLTLSQARGELDQARSAHAKALEEVSEVKVVKGRLDVEVRNAVEAITSHEGVVLEEAVRLPEPEDRAADEAELASLNEQIRVLGPVNQVALEQYQELEGRAAYIASQVEDLQAARSALEKIISAIDRKMRAGFLSTFEAVNKNFQEIFSMLFPDGRGHLELTEPDDPAATGVEVIAQPAGKRVTKMSLLSGGERSLTALGLLFAVYRTHTVPFYVLDEVEAALDDSNLDRLLAAVDTLRASTQFICISHQRRTMEKADVLYGVSMHADGVSHVVSQRLDGSI